MNRLLVLGLVVVVSCKTAPKAETAYTADVMPVPAPRGIVYKADISQSTIEWIGTKPTGRHHGTLKLREGMLVLGENGIEGGNFIIDINSLQPDDQKAEKNAMLQKHLLSDDFFDAAKFPLASFDIVSIDPATRRGASHIVTGNFRLKEITKSISFPASISVSGNRLSADAVFNLDRTLWKMHYGNDKSLGNWFIRPEVNIRLHLAAVRS